MSFKYTWSATDKFGQKVIKEVEAPSASEAQQGLLAAGYSDLELKEDEIMTTAHAGFSEKATVLGEEVKVTAQERVRQMANPPATTWGIIKPLLNQSKSLLLILILLSGYEAYRGRFTSAFLFIVALFVWSGFLVFLVLPQVYYRKLIEAADWYRWREVLSLVATLKTIGRMSIVKIPVSELTRYRAKAFAGLVDKAVGLGPDPFGGILENLDCQPVIVPDNCCGVAKSNLTNNMCGTDETDATLSSGLQRLE